MSPAERENILSLVRCYANAEGRGDDDEKAQVYSDIEAAMEAHLVTPPQEAWRGVMRRLLMVARGDVATLTDGVMQTLADADTLAATPPAPSHEPAALPPGMVYVPIRLTPAMERVFENEGWQWGDLLAAAETVDETTCEEADRAAPQDGSKAPAAANFDAEGFRAFVLRELPDDTIIVKGSWWADHLAKWAQKFSAEPAALQQAGEKA